MQKPNILSSENHLLAHSLEPLVQMTKNIDLLFLVEVLTFYKTGNSKEFGLKVVYDFFKKRDKAESNPLWLYF